uniref:AIG1-type G domain-containing protein n=1 Tax=Capra hircus TaxID=9925 RepID=A0A452DVP9_CAPHI
MWNGRSILVVDTPPIFESRAQDQEVYENIGACYLLSVPGPHVLLLVTQLGRFTEQDVVAVTRVKEVFGAGAERYMVILFTHKEDLAGGSLDEYVANTDNLRLRSLVRKCGRRYCAFNNRASRDEQREQLAQLMAVIEGLEREHQGAFLTNELFFDAQMLRQIRGGAHGEGQRRYLEKVILNGGLQKGPLRRGSQAAENTTQVPGYWCPHTIETAGPDQLLSVHWRKGKLIIEKKNHLGSLFRHFLSYSKRVLWIFGTPLFPSALALGILLTALQTMH